MALPKRNKTNKTSCGPEICDESDYIGLNDVVHFFVLSWKVLFLFGLAGLLVGFIAYKGQPKIFAAQVLIELAQIPVIQGEYGAVPVPSKWTPVEPPASLAQRLEMPTTYPAEVVKTCGFQDGAEIVRHVIVLAGPEPGSTFKFAVHHLSPDRALTCAQAVFEMIREQQASQVEDAIYPLKKSLAEILPSLRESVLKGKRGDSIEKILALGALHERLHKGAEARLLAPLYAPEEPLPSTGKKALLTWVAAGLFAGLSVAAFGALARRYRQFQQGLTS